VTTAFNVGLIGVFDEDGHAIASGSNGNQTPQAVAIAAHHKAACVVQPSYNELDCDPDITVVDGTVITASTGADPHNVVMATVGSQEMVYVYNRGDSMLRAYTLSGSQLTLAGTTVNLHLPTGTSNGFQISILGTSTAAILDQTNGVVVLIDLATMTETHRVTVTSGGGSFRLADDPTHNAFVVAVADAGARLTRFVSVDANTAAVTQLGATSTLLSVGLGTNSNGTISCMWDQCELVPHQ
jgi:hypothetical protein